MNKTQHTSQEKPQPKRLHHPLYLGIFLGLCSLLLFLWDVMPVGFLSGSHPFHHIPDSGSSHIFKQSKDHVKAYAPMLIVTPSPQLMPSIFEAARQACQAEPLFRHAVFPDAFLKSTDSYISTILFQVAEEKVQLLLVHPAIPGTEALFRHCKRQYPEIYCIAVAPMEPASQIEDAADLVLYPPLPGEAFQTLSSAKANTGKGPSAVLTSVKANVTQDPSAAPASTNANVTQDPSAAPASTGANVTKDPSTAPAFAVAEADLTPAQRKQNKALRAQYWESHAQCLEDLLLYIKNHDPASTVNDGLSLPEALQDYAQRKNLRR